MPWFAFDGGDSRIDETGGGLAGEHAQRLLGRDAPDALARLARRCPRDAASALHSAARNRSWPGSSR